MERLSPSAASLSVGCSSAAQQDDDVDEEQADQDEGEVDEQLLQVPLGLRVHLNLRRPADGRLGHVLDALHGDGLDFWLAGGSQQRWGRGDLELGLSEEEKVKASTLRSTWSSPRRDAEEKTQMQIGF